MTVEVILETPLAQALNSAIQPKLIEVGWSAGDDATALSEYIILMLVNGKNQEQITSELAGDLLQLGPDDPGAREFSQWLFQQIEVLDAQLNGGQEIHIQGETDEKADYQTNSQSQDLEMGDAQNSGNYVPTGPKSMRNNNIRGIGRDKRIMNHITKTLDRSNDNFLHRVRPQVGNERIGRSVPVGPRQQAGTPIRGGIRTQNNRANLTGSLHSGVHAVHSSPAANIMSMGPQQQLELYTMLEQQSRMMAQLLGAQEQARRAGPVASANESTFSHQPRKGRSLFDRAQQNIRETPNNIHKVRGNNYGDNLNQTSTENQTSSMDVEMSNNKKELDPENTTCKYNLACTNKDCKFAHQSPAAPAGSNIDFNDTCSFGAACKNRKCVGKHPSPAQKIAHQTELDCKYFPNCTNPRCPFRHPSMPLCRNGAECTTDECKYTHVKTMCKFNPCLNPSCTFKHNEGQKRGKFEDRVWTSDVTKDHVSERKFVNEDGPEELIVPGISEGGMNQTSHKRQLAT
ncbi:unnamed protein product [Blumeria hordei]|uniref:Nab2-like CCCH zinc finger domain-containing protein n=2 Tax=Blumeria hordei TaxID=2867405 RepID=A0A383URY8_BLUHO|nr:hypothetical protein BGHDH14_bgh00826 [Blumeria hordei DH14]SZF03081.1 unnamed protein product [Blumeria hordei]